MFPCSHYLDSVLLPALCPRHTGALAKLSAAIRVCPGFPTLQAARGHSPVWHQPDTGTPRGTPHTARTGTWQLLRVKPAQLSAHATNHTVLRARGQDTR